MEQSIKRFLQFNGKNIYFLSANGSWWIAIKPICEALGVNYEQQRKNLKDDKILAQLPCEHTVVAADGKLRKMVCLPEFFVYGWIFSIQSQSKNLTDYKMKCYELLYNYFHGTLTIRNKFLREKVMVEEEIRLAKAELSTDEKFIRFKELESKRIFTKRALDKLDKELVTDQIELFKTNNFMFELLLSFGIDNAKMFQSKLEELASMDKLERGAYNDDLNHLVEQMRKVAQGIYAMTHPNYKR